MSDRSRSDDEQPTIVGRLAPGARVEVRSRFDGSWAPGFEIAEDRDDGCHVRRLSDGLVLPRPFPHHDVRHQSTPPRW